MFSLTQFSILSVLSTLSSSCHKHKSKQLMAAKGKVCVCSVGDLWTPTANCLYFSAGVLCPIPDINTGWVPSASNTQFVVVVFFPKPLQLDVPMGS